MVEPKTRVDRFTTWIKNNPIMAALVVLGTVVIALSTFTDAARNLLDLVITDARPDINGEWREWSADIRFDEVNLDAGVFDVSVQVAAVLRSRTGVRQ